MSSRGWQKKQISDTLANVGAKFATKINAVKTCQAREKEQITNWRTHCQTEAGRLGDSGSSPSPYVAFDGTPILWDAILWQQAANEAYFDLLSCGDNDFDSLLEMRETKTEDDLSKVITVKQPRLKIEVKADQAVTKITNTLATQTTKLENTAQLLAFLPQHEEPITQVLPLEQRPQIQPSAPSL